MTLQVSADDKTAYAMLGGALDNVATAWTFTSAALKIYDKYDKAQSSGMSLARVMLHGAKFKSGAFSTVLARVNLAKKCYEYARIVQNALDETKRDGALFKFGLKVSLDLCTKWLGTSLTTHPYYAYHKVMLDALADALNAAHNSRAAVAAYRRAVSAATSKAVANGFKRLESRKVQIVAAHFQFSDRVGLAADIARGMYEPKFAERKIQQYGGAARVADALADLDAWRAMWAGLSFDAMKLMIMTGNELHMATAAMQKIHPLMQKLMSGHSVDVVAGYGAIDRMSGRSMTRSWAKSRPI
jgi:hypothetical protein